MLDHSTTEPGVDSGNAADAGGRTPAWPAGVAGGVAGVAGLAVSELAAWGLAPLGSPVTVVGEWVINLLPAWMINLGKEVFGLADKPILLGLVAVIVLVIAGASGRLEYARPGAGVVPPVLLTLVAFLAIALQSDGGWRDYLPTPIGLAVAYLVLRALIARLRQTAGRPGSAAAAESRRRFLLGAGVIGVASVAVGFGSRALAGGKAAVAKARSMVELPKPAEPAPAVPEGADLELPGLTPYTTPNETFYRIDTALQVPIIDPESWSLTITGMVQQQVTISFAELLELPLVQHDVTLTCVSNVVGGDLAGNARWLGYPIRDLLAKAGPAANADMVLSRSVDGFTAGTPLEVLTDQNRMALVAVGMNGEPLPSEHGFPARLVVPGLYGYVSATKWVTELKVTTFEADQGFWTPRGWSARGPIKMSARIDTPTESAEPGKVAVAGVAWAQHTGIAAVEVRVDDHPWQQARLAETIGPDTWRQWVFEWDAEPGDHQLTARATDNDGNRQIVEEAPPAPNGASGYHWRTISVG